MLICSRFFSELWNSSICEYTVAVDHIDGVNRRHFPYSIGLLGAPMLNPKFSFLSLRAKRSNPAIAEMRLLRDKTPRNDNGSRYCFNPGTL